MVMMILGYGIIPLVTTALEIMNCIDKSEKWNSEKKTSTNMHM